MKKFILLLLIYNTLIASDEGCLKKIWKIIPSTQNEKAFDLKHDYVKYDSWYSCGGFITPSKINQFLLEIKNALKNDDINTLSSMVLYPLNVKTSKRAIGSGKYIRNQMTTILTKKDFIKRYKKDIYSKELKDVFMCTKLSNMRIIPDDGIGIALGEIWLHVDYDTRVPKISILSTNKEVLQRWLDDECL